MKDQRFIELLNLYIDRQITAGETAELETEIQQNPSRQAVYRQYCQIHAATKLVYDSFRADVAEQPALQPDHTGVVELFETKRRKSHFAYYAGGLAAACLALVFIRHNAAPTGTELLTAAAKATVHPIAVAATRAPQVAAAPVKAVEPMIGLVSLRNNANTTPDYSAMLVALREQDEERAITNGRLQNNRTLALFDDGVFNSTRSATTQDQRLFRIQRTPAQQAEFTAFQFQR